MKSVHLLGAALLCAGVTASVHADGDLVQIELTNWQSWGDQGSASNSRLEFDLSTMLPGAVNGATITGIGWDVTIETIGGSWQSELTLGITDQMGSSTGLFLNPGAGTDTAGTGTFSSNGMLKLSELDIEDITIADGIVAIESFESFDDPGGADNGATMDAFVSGTISLQVLTNPIPAPGALAMLGLAGLAGRRRRRA